MSARKPATAATENSTPVAAPESDGIELLFTACYWPRGAAVLVTEDGDHEPVVGEGDSGERRIREGSTAILSRDEAFDVIEKQVARRVRR